MEKFDKSELSKKGIGPRPIEKKAIEKNINKALGMAKFKFKLNINKKLNKDIPPIEVNSNFFLPNFEINFEEKIH